MGKLPTMTLKVSGDCGPRNIHCWRAILEAVDQWSPAVEGATLEAEFQDEEMRLIFTEPNREPVSATVDISWIAYADQAERIGILTRMALVDLELARVAQRQAEVVA
jgi:hypothetical protein